MTHVRTRALLASLLLFGLVFPRPTGAADAEVEVLPPVTRPGGTVAIRTAAKLEPAKKVFLRLSGEGTVSDLTIEGDQAGRGVARIALPEKLREDDYTAELVNERGDKVAGGGHLRVLASEAPSITKIVPRASYAEHGLYAFEIVGEHFSRNVDDDVVMINDVPLVFARRLKDAAGGGRDQVAAAECRGQFPCLIGGRQTLRIYGLSLRDQFARPLQVSVQVDRLSSDQKLLLLAPVASSTPRLVAFAALGLIAGAVWIVSRRKAGRYRVDGTTYATWKYLFVESETNTYSLSRLQLILWTAAAVVAYVYLAASQFLVQWSWSLPDVPEGLPTLLGLSAGTTALAVGASDVRGGKGAGPLHPELGDFITTGGVLAPERLQFFIWTILGVVGFVSATLAQDPATVTELPKIPDNFVPLMGVSSLGYLAGKVARKPGPVIRQLAPAPPYGPSAPGAAPTVIRIVGEKLSPRAQVRLNGMMLPIAQVATASPQLAATEFVGELVVTVQSVAAPIAGVPAVKVTNPDGQSAEL
jgi:hypothetical protein